MPKVAAPGCLTFGMLDDTFGGPFWLDAGGGGPLAENVGRKTSARIAPAHWDDTDRGTIRERSRNGGWTIEGRLGEHLRLAEVSGGASLIN